MSVEKTATMLAVLGFLPFAFFTTLMLADPGLIGGLTADEIFIVLEGRAEVTFEDTKETIQIGPGDVVRLNAGQRNRWRTIERLRKISVWIPAQAQAPSS